MNSAEWNYKLIEKKKIIKQFCAKHSYIQLIFKLKTMKDNQKNISPIFILGCTKSGTTLLRNLFDGHPDLFIIPFETHFFFRKLVLGRLLFS